MLAVFLVRFQKMISLFSSLRSCTLILFITVLSLRTSNGEDHKHEICSSSLISCGKLHNVSYPFWGLGRPKYCGHPVLQLECPTFPNHDGYPFLKIGEVYYEILSIDNNNNTLPIINIQLREFNKSIGYPHHISIKDFDTIFHYSESVEKITLHVCCGEEIEEIPSWFKTNTNWGNDCLAYYYPEKISSTNKFQGCHRLEVPVIKDWEILLHRNESVTLFEVLQQGFKVDYLNSLACSKCKNSSGTCGSNDEGFACFQRKPDWKLIVGIVIPGAFIIIGAVNIGVWCCIKRKFYSSVLQSSRLPYVSMKSDIEVGSSFYGIPVLPYNELREATKNFDESQELGDGGFGVVYYGKLKDGREVAVKRLFEKNYKQIENFMNEIEILTHLRHPNLVTLYGCTSRSSRELLLVYDFIPNGTVADHLYGQRKGSETLSWDIRMKIATETARALSYLHASDIIHRDVKTNNILLDKNFSVKVADFGLSRLFPCNATHVSTVPQGTPGYLDPQYHKNYQVTNKSDVYSFGVVLVELISSLPAVDISRQEDEINLYDYAMSRIQHGILSELVDQNLGFESDFKVNRMVTLVAELAFRSLQQERELRPTMVEILEALEEIGSMDYKALKAEDKNLSKSASKTKSMTLENHIEPSLRNTHHLPSPNSVIASWVSRSTASNTST